MISVTAMLAACNTSILSLLGKTNQSVSFGDQTYSLADVEKLMRVRDKLTTEQRTLEGILTGCRRRRTVKIEFTE